MGRDLADYLFNHWTPISIHAPRVGRDQRKAQITIFNEYFNPRAPCGARPHGGLFFMRRKADFNPRAPCGARRGGRLASDPRDHISIHAPRVGRDSRARRGGGSIHTISIHAPRVGRDVGLITSASRSTFQSTRPVWGATLHSVIPPVPNQHFNPRAPCGARLVYDNFYQMIKKISIHAPRVGRDMCAAMTSAGS